MVRKIPSCWLNNRSGTQFVVVICTYSIFKSFGNFSTFISSSAKPYFILAMFDIASACDRYLNVSLFWGFFLCEVVFGLAVWKCTRCLKLEVGAPLSSLLNFLVLDRNWIGRKFFSEFFVNDACLVSPLARSNFFPILTLYTDIDFF